jgi:tRNA threonylcarbamoyladenosine biosynthesis protein TsaE
MEKEFTVTGERELKQLAHELYALRDRVKVYTFTGPLGAGKTTLIRELVHCWGITQPITSPTFTYVNVYETPQEELLYHFDLYRIHSLDEFVNAGFDEFLYVENSWAFIEWPEIIRPLLTRNVCDITLDYVDKETRKVRYEIIP